MPESPDVEDGVDPAENEGKSLSELLASYYGLSEDDGATGDDKEAAGGVENEAEPKVDIFGSDDFDVDVHFKETIEKSSISEIISLQRRLEREIRQYTAGKQLMIYDNYGCLFTALDAVHAINGELATVQKHLLALKESQIKAACIDVSNRYGIRESFMQLADINRVCNLFKSLVLMTRWLQSLEDSNGNFKVENNDQYDYTLNFSVLVKIFNSVKAMETVCVSNTAATKLVKHLSLNVNKWAPKILKFNLDHYLSVGAEPGDLKLLSEAIGGLRCSCDPLVLKIAAKSVNVRIERISESYKNDSPSIGDLCTSVGHKVLSLVDEFVTGALANGSLDDNALNNKAVCPFCSCNYNITLQFEESAVFDKLVVEPIKENFRFDASAKSECSCNLQRLNFQFAYTYTHLAFSPILKFIVDENSGRNVSVSDFIAGLTGILAGANYSTMVNELTLHWLLALACYRIQCEFYGFYMLLIDSLLRLLQEDFNTEMLQKLSNVLLKFIKSELDAIVSFFKDIKHSLNLDTITILVNALTWCIGGLDSSFEIFYDSVVYNHELCNVHVDYLDSCANLTTLARCMEVSGAVDDATLKEMFDGVKLRLLGKGKGPSSYNNTCIDRDTLKTRLDIGAFIKDYIDSKMASVDWSNVDMRTCTIRLASCMQHMIDFENDLYVAINERLPQFSGIYPEHTFNLVDVPGLVYGPDATAIFNSKSGIGLIEHQFPNLTFSTVLLHSLSTSNYYRLFPHQRVHLNVEEVPVKMGLNLPQLLSSIQSRVIYRRIHQTTRLIKFTFENARYNTEHVEHAYRDLTVLLSEMLKDFEIYATTSRVAPKAIPKAGAINVDNVIKECIECGSLLPASNLHAMAFDAGPNSRDTCLKIFTIHLVFAIHYCKSTLLLDAHVQYKLIKSFQQQILFLFKKGVDIKLIINLWGLIM